MLSLFGNPKEQKKTPLTKLQPSAENLPAGAPATLQTPPPPATAQSSASSDKKASSQTAAAEKANLLGGFLAIDRDAPLQPHQFNPRFELLKAGPRVLISPEAYKQMLLYVELASKEVGWLGTVTQLPSGNFFIDHTYLLEQEVTSTETELSVDGQNKLVDQLLAKGDDQGVDRVNRLRFWGHSHVRMGTTPSGTDESTMHRFGNEGLPWYIRGIFNKLGRGSFAIYYYDRGYRILDAPWAVWSKDQGVILDGSKQEAPATTSNPGQKQPTGVPAAQPETDSLAGRISKLPPVCIPGDALRAAVTAEFKAKVTERAPFVFNWFKGLNTKAEESK